MPYVPGMDNQYPWGVGHPGSPPLFLFQNRRAAEAARSEMNKTGERFYGRVELFDLSEQEDLL